MTRYIVQALRHGSWVRASIAYACEDRAIAALCRLGVQSPGTAYRIEEVRRG